MMDETLEDLDLEDLKKDPDFKELIELKLLLKQGFRANGMGLLLSKLDKIFAKVDKIALSQYHLEKKVDKIIEK